MGLLLFVCASNCFIPPLLPSALSLITTLLLHHACPTLSTRDDFKEASQQGDVYLAKERAISPSSYPHLLILGFSLTPLTVYRYHHSDIAFGHVFCLLPVFSSMA